MIGPIESFDDVCMTLGRWQLTQEKLTDAEVRKMIVAARELALYVECNLKLKALTESGFETSYFSPQRRNEIRTVLAEMDSISAGSETTIQRRNETLSGKGGQ